MSRHLRGFLKLLVSLGLLAYLVMVVDWGRALEVVREARLSILLISPVFWFGGLLVASQRWRLVTGVRGSRLGFGTAFGGYLVGSIYNLFLPGSVGGDVVRARIAAGKTGCGSGRALAGVLTERVGGVLALLVLLAVTSLVFPHVWARLLPELTAAGVRILVLLLLAVSAALLLSRRGWLRLSSGEGGGRVRRFLRGFAGKIAELRLSTVLAVMGMSIIFQGIRLSGICLLSRAIGVSLGIEVFFAVIPLVYLATLLPVSLGGLGVREGSLALLLGGFGVDASQAVVLGFLVYLNQVLLAIAGGLLQLMGRVSPFSSRGTHPGYGRSS